MIATTVTKKGQVTIPKKIREALGLREHDKVVFIHRNNEVVLKPIKGTILNLRGSVKPRRKPENFETIRKEVKGAITRRIAGESKNG